MLLVGPPCEKKKALCDPNPCRYGGQCAETPKGFVCLCPDSQFDLDCTPRSCQEERNCTAGEHVRASFFLFVFSQWGVNTKWHMKINSVPKQDQMTSFWRLGWQLISPAEDEQREGVPSFSSILIKWPSAYLSVSLKWLSSKPFCNWMPAVIFTFHCKCYCAHTFCKAGSVLNGGLSGGNTQVL